MNAALNAMTDSFINKHFGDLNYNHLDYILFIVLGFAAMGIITTLIINPVRVFIKDDDNIASDRSIIDRDLSFGQAAIRTQVTQDSLVVAHMNSDKKVRYRGLGEKETSYQRYADAHPKEGGTPSDSPKKSISGGTRKRRGGEEPAITEEIYK